MRCLVLITLLALSPELGAQCAGDKTTSPLGPNGRFGETLASDGNDLIVGSPGADAVAFYRWSGGAWVPAGAPIVGPSGLGYGTTVALRNGVAFVGLPRRDSSGLTDSGSVQVFTSSAPGVWSSVGAFISPLPVAGGRFGHDVDTDGVRVIVGEPGFNSSKGRFHIFTIGAGGSVTLEQSQSSPSVAIGAELGHAVAIDGDAAGVGAPYADFAGFVNNGLGLFFRRNPSGIWAQKSTWTYQGPGFNAGWSIDVSGPFGLIGAPGLTSSFTGGYIFSEWDGVAYALDTWSSIDVQEKDVGWHVQLEGNRGLVCSPNDSSHVAPTTSVGSFNLFEHNGVEFDHVALWDVFPMHDPSLEFGRGAALVGGRAVIGAPGDPVAGAEAGAFYDYDTSVSAWQFGFHSQDSLAGSGFAPSLILMGSVCESEPMYLHVGPTPPNAPIVLIIGNQHVPTSLLGGTLGPTPDLILAGLSANASGELNILAQMPAALPAGALLYLQAWVVDATGPQGYTDSATRYMKTAF